MDETVGLAALDTASLFSDDCLLNLAGDLLLFLDPLFWLDLVFGLGALVGFGLILYFLALFAKALCAFVL